MGRSRLPLPDFRRMVRGRSGLVALGLGLPVALAGVVACGDDAPSSGPTDPPAASAPVSGGGGPPAGDPAAIGRGQELARTRGCTACHGASGEGGLGPAWIDVIGTQVTFTDGSTAVVDVPYISRSIAEPDAQVVTGFAVAMPKTELTEGEVADLVAYVASLSG